MLEDQHIAALLAQCRPGRQALEGCVEALVKGANEAGGLDNVTVVLARLP
jgi:serine/threonine protein phosphatase PrpC